MSTTPNRPARLNRGLLALVGLLLLLAGAYTLLRGFGLVAPLAPGRGQAPDGPVLAADITAPSWLPYLVIVAATIVGLLCLLWLAAQIGRRRPGSATWRLSKEEAAGTTVLDTDAAATAVAHEIEDYTGVSRVSAAITGARARPHLHLTVTTEDDAEITTLRHRIDVEALPRLRGALEIDDLPTDLLVRLGSAPAGRHIA